MHITISEFALHTDIEEMQMRLKLAALSCNHKGRKNTHLEEKRRCVKQHNKGMSALVAQVTQLVN